MGTANFKYDDEPMGRLMGLPPEFLPSNGRNYSGPFKKEELFDEDPKNARKRLHTKMRVTHQDKMVDEQQGNDDDYEDNEVEITLMNDDF